MRYGRRHRDTAPPMGFNATPLVDIVFLLTIFFMLVSRFASEEQIAMELPRPDHSQAKISKMADRVVINCRPADLRGAATGEVLYSIGPNRPEALAVIGDRLAALKREFPAIKVVVRADRRLPYADVRAVMYVVAQQGIEMLSVVAHVAEGD